jgi:hypothetical protein
MPVPYENATRSDAFGAPAAMARRSDDTKLTEPRPRRRMSASQSMNEHTNTDQTQQKTVCPLSDADDKFQEAHYFLEEMMNHYHEPAPFRWNLNAFLQALRSVTFFLQKSLAHREGFSDFWEAQQEAMRGDALLRRFVAGRNVVVKQRNLEINSKAVLGVYNHRRLRIGMSMHVPAYARSADIIERHASKLGLIDDSRVALWEEYGVERQWFAPELGEGEVLVLCDDAWVRISRVNDAAHQFAGWTCAKPSGHHHRPDKCNLLTETDIHPELADEWGWNE